MAQTLDTISTIRREPPLVTRNPRGGDAVLPLTKPDNLCGFGRPGVRSGPRGHRRYIFVQAPVTYVEKGPRTRRFGTLGPACCARPVESPSSS
jgi:hypothetical protein